MTTFELDLSKSDSFIDGIQEIFKPPSVDSATNIRVSKGYMKSLHSCQTTDAILKDASVTDDYDNLTAMKVGNISWKKPKANAHEYCDSCGTFEGERLVCDRCPASFHLECLDPPIEMEEAPIGVWYCNRCTAVMKEEEDKLSCNSEHSQGKDAEIGNNNNNRGNNNNNNVCRGNTGSVKRSARSLSSGSSEVTTEMSAEEAPVKKRKRSEHLVALRNLQDVVQCINPKEFELPKHLIPGIKLPFTFKTNSEMKTKSVVSLENGIIPRPLVTCYECSRTCLYGSLLQCDYCPFYFHLDCLDPPLVQLPSRVERWMCPNHIEQVVDNSGLIKTIRLSERMNVYSEIYDHISNIDEIDLLTNFGLGRGFRFGSKMEKDEIVKTKPRVEVPDAVKRLYREPVGQFAKSMQRNYLPCETEGNDGEPILNGEQRKIMENILKASRKDINLEDMDPVRLLHVALESIESLVQCQALSSLQAPDSLLNSFSRPSVVTPVISARPGADNVKARALFVPLSEDPNVENTPIRMIYRNFDIGSSIDNDCVVSGCKFVSPRHASISYIDNHFCFELVNYSRYGTIVDDLLYYNDVSEKAVDSHSTKTAGQNIRDIRSFLDTLSTDTPSQLNTNNKAAITSLGNSMHCQRDMDKVSTRCACSEYGYSNSALNDCIDRGWEGSAPIKFGSIIHIGCQKFMFTDTSMTTTTDTHNDDGDNEGVDDDDDVLLSTKPVSSSSSPSSSLCSTDDPSSLTQHNTINNIAATVAATSTNNNIGDDSERGVMEGDCGQPSVVTAESSAQQVLLLADNNNNNNNNNNNGDDD